MIAVLDAALTLIEPGGGIDLATALRPATSGTTVDHAAARPFEFEFDGDRLYGWPAAARHQVMEVGNPPSFRQNFTLDLAYVIGNGGEQAKARRSRAVSLALDVKAETYLSVLASNVELAGSWEEIVGELNPDVIRGFDVRGIGLRLTGWRYLQGA